MKEQHSVAVLEEIQDARRFLENYPKKKSQYKLTLFLLVITATIGGGVAVFFQTRGNHTLEAVLFWFLLPTAFWKDTRKLKKRKDMSAALVDLAE
jgi:pheromone shutdown protein TraB